MPQRSIIADPFKFAFEGRRLAGRVALAALERLQDVLVETDGEIEYAIEGSLGADRKPRLQVTASGSFVLRCQRCLEPMDWPFEIASTLLLVRPGQPIPEEELEEDEYDAIEAEPDMDVLAVVEDEIVLALTVAPRHERCEAPRPLGGVSKESPLAALAKLRKGNDAN